VTTFIGLKVVVVGGKSMERLKDDAELVQALLDAAELLLPVASATEWPCAPEVAAWLVAIRDTFDPGRVVH
jgi:hypothetical protein